MQTQVAVRPLASNLMATLDKSQWYLSLLFISALLIRAVTAFLFAGEIDGEGSEYARIAQNLLEGNGYTGIATPGIQLFFPPLFPFLIAGVTLVVGDAELAGRLINIFFSALLVIPAYSLTRQLYGEASGKLAAALVAFHPFLVVYATTVHSEITNLTLIAFAVSSAMALGAHSSWRAHAATGALYAASCLVRPDAFAFMLVSLVFVLLTRVFIDRAPVMQSAGRLLIVPLVFITICFPYIAWLSAQTGQLRFEGKSLPNIMTELRIQNGMTIDEASFSIDQSSNPSGVWNRANIEIFEGPRPGLTEVVKMMINKTKPVLRAAANVLGAGLEFGSPALLVLAAFGLFGRPWRPSVALRQVHLLTLAALSLFATYFIYYVHFRFYIFLLLLLIVWASPAAIGFGRWAAASAALAGFGQCVRTVVARVASAVALLAMLLPATAVNASKLLEFRASRPLKLEALKLAASGTRPRIAGITPAFAFHANADFVWLPYSDEKTALKFLDRNQVTHVLAQNWAATMDARPYSRKWASEGIPNASKIAVVMTRNGEFTLWELNSSAGD